MIRCQAVSRVFEYKQTELQYFQFLVECKLLPIKYMIKFLFKFFLFPFFFNYLQFQTKIFIFFLWRLLQLTYVFIKSDKRKLMRLCVCVKEIGYKTCQSCLKTRGMIKAPRDRCFQLYEHSRKEPLQKATGTEVMRGEKRET